MVEFLISGPITGTVVVGTVLSPVAISGSITAAPPAYIGTIGTILSPVDVTGTFLGTVVAAGTVVVSTIDNAPLVTVQGMVSVPLVQVVATIGTIVSQLADAIQQQFGGTYILTNQTIATSGAATLVMASLQDLVVDYVFGTALAGSVLPYVTDVEEQTGFQTGTNVSPTGGGAWFAGTVRGGHRLVVAGATGFMVAVGWLMSSGGTVGVGTVTNVYITARPVEGP